MSDDSDNAEESLILSSQTIKKEIQHDNPDEQSERRVEMPKTISRVSSVKITEKPKSANDAQNVYSYLLLFYISILS